MNRVKLKALVHYVIAKSDPSRLGAIRLNKILFYLDALTYRATGSSLTGETYIKRQFGPVPKHILNVLGDLEHEGAIVIRSLDRFGDDMREFITIKDPDVSALDAHELALADDLRLEICEGHTARSISEATHDKVWEAANMAEKIPLAATLVARTGAPNNDVYKWADSVVRRYEAPQRAA